MAKFNFNLEQALKKGTLSMVKLDQSDAFLLILTSKKTELVIPLIKTEDLCFGYVDPELGDRTLLLVEAVLNALNTEKVFKGMYQYSPKSGKAPEHSHKTVQLMKNSKGKTVSANNLNEVLVRNGYTELETMVTAVTDIRKDDGLLDLPENRKNFDMAKNHLEKIGATFEKLPVEAKLVYDMIQRRESIGVIMSGPTGTGKTTMARTMITEMNLAFINVSMDPGKLPEDLEAKSLPNDDPESKAPFKYVLQCLLKAYSEGYALLVDEFNFATPEVLSKFNQYTDDTSAIYVDGKWYYRHPNFCVFLTMNPGYAGTKQINDSMKNRFEILQIPGLTKDEFTKRMLKFSKDKGYMLSPEFFGELFDIALWLEKEGGSAKWHESVVYSIRQAESFTAKVLVKSRNFEEFFGALNTSYTNMFSLDNDNSAKLEAFKTASTTVERVKKLFNLYSFAEDEKVDPAEDIMEFFTEREETPEAATSGSFVDAIFDRFALYTTKK